MNSSKYFLLFLSIIIVTLTSCTPLVHNGRIPQDASDSSATTADSLLFKVEVLDSQSVKPSRESYIITDAETIISICDTLVTSGENAAGDGEFTLGHELIILSMDLLNSSKISEKEESLLNKLQIYERVGNFYVNLTPPSYLDSVPSELSSYVSRVQLEEIMNHFDTTQIDTNIIRESCGDWSHYNIPIVNNTRVQSAVTAMLATRRKRYMERLLNKAIMYRPFMNEIFEREELPTDLTFLPLLESAFNMKAYSKASASGLWQFIESTGKIFKLRNNYWVDERRDPVKSTEAAIGYFKKLYRDFGDWHLALASYNCGEGRVRRTMKKMSQNNYWGLELPQETMNYVPLYIAYQIIAKNPNCFGYNVDSTISPYEFDTVQISDCIDMRKIAKGTSTPLETLEVMNPHIIQWCTPPNMENINLYLPKGKAETFKKFYKTLSKNDKVNWYRYRVQIGDNLGYLCEKFQTSMSALKSINNMKGSALIAGRHIFVPIPSDANIDSLLAETNDKAKEHLLNTTKERIIYKVSSGESMYGIALQFDVKVKDICDWNKKENPRSLSVGEKLVLYIDPAHVKKANEKSNTKKVIKDKKKYHLVVTGETLYSISNTLGIELSDLLDWNDKDPQTPIIHPGEKLAYYGGKTSNTSTSNSNSKSKTTSEKKAIKRRILKYKVNSGDTYYSISRLFNVSVQEILKLNKLTENDLLHPGDIILVPQPTKETTTASNKPQKVKKYKIKSGDTLWSISRIFNVSVSDICKASGISKDTALKPDFVLTIPVQ